MAGLNTFITVIVTLVVKDGALSCLFQSHKSGSSSPTGSISVTHHDLDSKPHTTHAPCGPSIVSSTNSQNILPNLSNGLVLPSKLNLTSAILLPAISTPTPVLSDYNQDILNCIIKLLSSSSTSTATPVLKTPPISNTAKFPTSKLHTTSHPYVLSSGSKSCSPGLLHGSDGPSTLTPVPSQQIPVLTPVPSSNMFQTPGVSSDFLNFLLKLLSLVTGVKTSFVAYRKPLSPPGPLFRPILNKEVTEISTTSKLHNKSLACIPSLDSSSCTSNILPNKPCSSASPPKLTVPEPAPEEFPAPTQVSSQGPTSICAPSTFYGHNSSAIINLIIKCLLTAPQTSTVSSNPLTPIISSPYLHSMSHINTPQVIASVLKPYKTHSTYTTKPNSSSYLPSVLPSLSSVSVVSTNLTSVPTTSSPVSVPTSTAAISSGYNPNFIKLLIKHLLSNSTSSSPPLSSPFHIIHKTLNTTSIFPPLPNPFSESTSYKPIDVTNHLFEPNKNVSDKSYNKSCILASASTPVSTQVPINNTNTNTSLNNNCFLTKLVCKVLSPSSLVLKIPPCLPSSSPHSISIFNITSVTNPNQKPLTTTSLIDLPSGLKSKCPSPTSSSSLSSTDKTSVFSTPSSVQIPFLESNKNHNYSKIVLKPTRRPKLCRTKHSRLPHRKSTSSGNNPCHKNILRTHTTPLPLPHSIPHKLGSDCKSL